MATCTIVLRNAPYVLLFTTLIGCSGSESNQALGEVGGARPSGSYSMVGGASAAATGGVTSAVAGQGGATPVTTDATSPTGGVKSVGGSTFIATGTVLITAPGGAPSSGGGAATGGGLPNGGTATWGKTTTGGMAATGGRRWSSAGNASSGGLQNGGASATQTAATVLATGGTGATGGVANSGGTSSTGTTVPPSGLPSHMLMGYFASDNAETWMSKSGTKWDVRWVYLSGQHGNNWYNLWTYGAADGAWMSDWFKQCDQQGFIPGVHLYNMGYGHDQGDAGLLTQIRNPTFVADYFTEFKAMMQRAKDFGKPVLIVLEGDTFGMLEMLTKNDPNAAASVASSGLAELQGLPNTLAGLGMAYLQIRKSVGANNVLLGPDMPAYAADGDIMNGDNSDLQPHVDYQLKFFGPFGLGENQTGARFDFAASCPLAGDADYYRMVAGDSGRWWDTSDTASENSKSFNRYAKWMSLVGKTAGGLRWVLHQVPVGNSNNLNTNSDCGSPTDKCTPRSGYKDNRAEYFLNYDAPSSKTIRNGHLQKFADAGVIALLFGGGYGGSTTAYNDTWTDGKLFLKSRVAQLVEDTNGGFPIK